MDHIPGLFFYSLKIQVFEKGKKLTFMGKQFWVKDCARQCLYVFGLKHLEIVGQLCSQLKAGRTEA